MAYVSKDLKAKLSTQVKEICKKYGVSATLAIRNHSTLVLNVKAGEIDFLGNYRQNVKKQAELRPAMYHVDFSSDLDKQQYIQVNEYRIDESFSDVANNFLKEVNCAMNEGNHDDSDLQTDYFCVGWYTEINIGKWDKPYEFRI